MTTSQKISAQLNKFFREESSGAILMIGTVIIAMILANGTTAEWYDSFVNLDINVSFGGYSFHEPLKYWVQDVLMVFFFLLVGMELKREMVDGFLSTKNQIALPFVAALGGMIVPALIYLLINYNSPQYWKGWAIPSATDIAFALCILMLARKHVPPALKTFLLAIAIFDDLGIIVIIAFFYSAKITLTHLFLILLGCFGLFVLNYFRVMAISLYMAAGVILWFILFHSGIHTTLCGVIVGMAIPLHNPRKPHLSPLNKCMQLLHPWVSFFILPFFAFTAAGINFNGMSYHTLFNPLVLSITISLFIGKQLGIYGTTWLMIKSRLAKLPTGTNWGQIYGISLIAGIGFTMSIFIGMLAFKNGLSQNEVKLGIFTGSFLAGLFGWLVIRKSISA